MYEIYHLTWILTFFPAIADVVITLSRYVGTLGRQKRRERLFGVCRRAAVRGGTYADCLRPTAKLKFCFYSNRADFCSRGLQLR